MLGRFLAPLVLALVVLRTFEGILEGASLRLRQIRNDARQARLSARLYSPSDPEPYGSLASALAKGLDDVDLQVQDLYEEYAVLRQRTSLLATPRDFRILMRLPWETYEITRLAQELRRRIDRLGRNLDVAVGLVEKLDRQGWEVALQARQLWQDARKAHQSLEALRAHNLSDTSLDNWIEQGKGWERRLKNEVPVYFMSGSEDEVLAQNDRQLISAMYQLTRNGRPTVDGLLAKAREWEGQVIALEKASDEMAALFQQLSTEMRDLENHPVRPIVWDRSRKVLSGIGQQSDRLIHGVKTRALEEVKQDLAAALSILEQLNKLASISRQVAQDHQELLELLGSAHIQDGLAWCRNAQKIAEAAAVYDPENWPRTDGAARLRGDLQALYELQGGLTDLQEAGSGKPAAIRETELEGDLLSARQLVQMHADLRPRMAHIQKRFQDMQAMEQAARENIAKARALLNQAEAILASNPMLSKAATEAKSAREGLNAVIAQLDQPGRSAVDGKVQRAEGLLRKAEQSGNAWLALLNADLEKQKASLRQRVDRLAAIALLDDPAFAEAQQLLAAEQQQERAGQTRRSARSSADLTLSEAVAELKRQNEEWQRCTSLLKAIESIEGAVIEDYERAAELRQKALEQIARAAELLPETRSWPPSTQTISTERKEFNKIEQQWKALAQERIQPIRLVSRLGGLAGEYQSLAARISQKAERAGEERNRFRELENRLAESKGMWQTQMQIHADNAITRDEIHLLLEEVEQESEAIRERYRRGSILYNQALQNLRMVCQKLDDALIPLDNTQDIDITGELYPRR